MLADELGVLAHSLTDAAEDDALHQQKKKDNGYLDGILMNTLQHVRMQCSIDHRLIALLVTCRSVVRHLKQHVSNP